MLKLHTSWAVCSLAISALAASFPPKPEGLTIVQSTRFPGVSISFKETTICETTEGIKGYSGYVNLPANPVGNRNYESHMYFWFFEARNETKKAPLSIWFAGGPGVPSSKSALGQNGPCIVLEDSKSTELAPWSWNNKVNMLYIDQPVQVGYSYDSIVNGTIDIVSSPFAYKPANFSKTGVPETNLTFLAGTFASQTLANAPNTSMAAAPFIWEFMQSWIQEFPKYKSLDNRVSIWGESYGGHWATNTADYFEQQNDKIVAGVLNNTSIIPLHLDTVGFINACIDIDTQMIFYPEFAHNNTYGIQAINDTQYTSAIAASPVCKNMTARCRNLAAAKDPDGVGNHPDVNTACYAAFNYCFANMHDAYVKSGRNNFDVTTVAYPQSFPAKWAGGYLNTPEVQQALGVPLNWTGQSVPVGIGFNGTGDFILGNQLPKLSGLLARGVKVSLVYGDKDYQCNWLGGEALSLALGSEDFRNAGYGEIQTNASYVGGVVRQQGNLTFARVFQAGHELPYYQPETANQIFNRVMFNTDVSTGIESCVQYGYATKGPRSAWSTSELPKEQGTAKCYVWDVLETCTKEEEAVLRSGNAIVKDWVLVGAGNATT